MVSRKMIVRVGDIGDQGQGVTRRSRTKVTRIKRRGDILIPREVNDQSLESITTDTVRRRTRTRKMAKMRKTWTQRFVRKDFSRNNLKKPVI